MDAARSALDDARRDLTESLRALNGAVLSWDDFKTGFLRGCNMALSVMAQVFNSRSWVERRIAQSLYNSARQAIINLRDGLAAQWNRMNWDNLKKLLEVALTATQIRFNVPNPSFWNPLRTRTVTLDLLGAQRQTLVAARTRIADLHGKIQFRVKANTAADKAVGVAEGVLRQVEQIGILQIERLALNSAVDSLSGGGLTLNATVRAYNRSQSIQLAFNPDPAALAKGLYGLIKP